MKRYLLFAGEDYYPRGGWSDFIGDFDTIDEAKNYKIEYIDWIQIVDLETGKWNEDK
jgi:menaquinone-dependent protoporphyrinogen IX oxidase